MNLQIGSYIWVSHQAFDSEGCGPTKGQALARGSCLNEILRVFLASAVQVRVIQHERYVSVGRFWAEKPENQGF